MTTLTVEITDFADDTLHATLHFNGVCLTTTEGAAIKVGEFVEFINRIQPDCICNWHTLPPFLSEEVVRGTGFVIVEPDCLRKERDINLKYHKK